MAKSSKQPPIKLNAPVGFLNAIPEVKDATSDNESVEVIEHLTMETNEDKPVTEQEYSGIEEYYQSLNKFNQDDQKTGKVSVTVQLSEDEKKKLNAICMVLGCSQGVIIGLAISDIHSRYKRDIDKLIAKKFKI